MKLSVDALKVVLIITKKKIELLIASSSSVITADILNVFNDFYVS